MTTSDSVPPPWPPEPLVRRFPFFLGVLACLASLGLYARPILRPTLIQDDYQILVRSWTWQQAWEGLWVPANEHAMPPGRLTTWALIQLAGRPTMVPHVCVLQGPLAAVAGMCLVYVLIRRELGHPVFALAAMALFGVSSVYQQAVWWFSASFSVLALDTFLLALLAAQGWRRTGRWYQLGLCVLWSALAPSWFASGVLAGPLCGLYLLLPEGRLPGRRGALKSLGLALVPVLGTVLFLAVSLPRTADAIAHLEHYQGKPLAKVIQPRPGLLYTLWSVVENLLLGVVGISSVNVPLAAAGMVWPLLLLAAAWCWEAAPAGRRLMLLGLGLIFGSYLMVYSARADWGYEGHMNRPNWSRYHLLPQLGLALFVAGALSRWRFKEPPGLTRAQALAVLGLILLLFASQLPRVLLTGYWTDHEEQAAALRQIEEVDARCRKHGISAEAAVEALPPLEIPHSYTEINGWLFLRGSDQPDPSLRGAAVRQLLLPDD